MSEGNCIPEGNCPAPVNDFTNWTNWSKAVCRKGQTKETRNRICKAKVTLLLTQIFSNEVDFFKFSRARVKQAKLEMKELVDQEVGQHGLSGPIVLSLAS